MGMGKAYFNSPIGWLEIESGKKGIRRITRVDKPGQSDADEALLQTATLQLESYFSGDLQGFTLPLDWEGEPEFSQQVWKMLLEIPYGHTASYLSIAEKLGNPKAVRAVGQANRHNPIAIVVPCHRVIAKNGDLQGYFYGLDVKRQLLQLENPNSFGIQSALF
ncbi:MAG: methylated-DNA--[protein]-cysteine S-methyltransferase [Saprospiraceae bacterium]|nr:methylated-DNA--[protein]-cysteine S-methyltransferase [Saprospiraceae bacterium]